LEERRALVLLTREDCELCDEFLAELRQLARRLPLPPLELRLVDSDPQMQRRFGLKVPVLLWDDVPIAATRLDATELARLFRPGRSAS